jgi:exodeoxyribonuclease X
MLVAVIDTETTGASETDQVCELAVVTVTTAGKIKRRADQLIKPTCSISPVARAVHHITDEELRCSPTMKSLAERGESALSLIRSADCVAGHFIDFDLRMLAQSGFDAAKPRVCTWQCARHLWPDAPAYGNQVLRYWLSLAVPRAARPPHRALTDALTTATLLTEMLKTRTIYELFILTHSPVLMTSVKFGKYRGLTWREVRLRDRGYLSWILKQDFGADERHTAEHWLRKKRGEIDGEDSELLQVREGSARDPSAEAGGSAEGSANGGPDTAAVSIHERVPGAGPNDGVVQEVREGPDAKRP